MDTFRILNITLACFIAALFPRNAVGGSVGNGSNGLSQTSDLTQTNDYPDLRLSKEFFKRYLENPYPVRKVVFFEPKDADDPTNVLLIEGSLQPDTFYIRQLRSPRILEDKYINRSGSRIMGKSSDGEYWSINDAAARGKGGDISITTAGTPDDLAMTAARFRACESLPSMRSACWFGFNFMVPHTAVWHGDRFDMQFLVAQGYPHVTNTYMVSGEVVSYTNNLPLVIRVKSDHWPKKLQWIEFTYEYDFSPKDRFYPVKATSAGMFAGHPTLIRPMTTDTLEIEFGNAALPEGGYTMSNFLPQDIAVPADVYVTSSQGEYWVNGKQFVTKGILSPPRRPLFHINLYVRILLISLMILPAVLFIRWRKIKPKKQTTNKT